MQTVFKLGDYGIKTDKTELDYREALKRLEDIFDAKLGTPESDELEILGLMVDDYENKHYPIEAPDPIEAIKIRMEEMHLRQIDLIPEIGGKSRVSLTGCHIPLPVSRF
jgi:HTH-type transcriptional regulator/antitoxin HigA